MEVPNAATESSKEGEGEKRQTSQTQAQTQLFPLFSLSSNPSSSLPESTEAVQWLSNRSFAFDVSAIPAAAAIPAEFSLAESDEEEATEGGRPSYDLVSSPSSSSGVRPLKREENRRRRKRKREMDTDKLGHETSRKSDARAWIGSEKKPAKDYYFDARGDRDNLAFGCLYRMDVARYKLLNPEDFPGVCCELLHHQRCSKSFMEVDHDLDVLDNQLRVGRYYSVKYMVLERFKDFKHVKIMEKMPSFITCEYIPLVELHSFNGNGGNGSNTGLELEESWEDEIVRITRELNIKSRDFPHDEKVWLAFAEFQDKIACSLPQKAARLQTLEKKISILEKAVDLNPDNEELLLCLLKSYQGRDNIGSLMEKWQKVLVQHFDSVKLWKEFLLVQQGEFSQFTVSNIRKAYGHAIQALSSACNKLCRQGFQVSSLKSGDSSLIQLECGLVDVFINLCRFEWQTGHHELATGLFQAEIEYSLFCPSLLLSSHTKQKLFEHFWNSSGARVGEDGALGWCNWMELEEQNKINPMLVENLEEVQGGWSGWMDPLSKQSTTMDEHVELLVDENTVENSAIGDIPPNDVESLLKNLGIDVEAGSHTEAKDALTWKKWLQEELSRDAEQWMPIRNNSGNYGGLGLHCLEDSEKEQLSRVVLFEDVTDYLFSLCSEEARFSLVYQFIDFFGGKLSSWTCTNDANWMDKVLSLEFLDDLISEDLIVVSKALNRMGNSVLSEMTSLLESNVDCFSKSALVEFLRNAILLCLNAFPRNRRLEEALIANEERLMTNLSNSTSPTNPSRALAKALLKRDRQDLLLCGIYARSEASYGNIDIARKIFDMALSSANGLPEELVEHYPLLFLWYAEMELAACTSSSNTEQFLQRAVHILCCLGGNIKFIPFTSQPSSLHILRARQGFKEQVKNLSSAWARGDIKESSIALICSAFLFEHLTNGWSSGLQIIEEAFYAVLPERRIYSLQLESLWMRYMRILKKHIMQLKFSTVWKAVAQSLQMYPYNPRSFSTMVELSSLFTVPLKVRQVFDDYIQRKPSVVVYLFALAFEFCKPGTKHRVHGLFEKALTNNNNVQKSVLLWRLYLAYEADIVCNPSAAKRIFFRAIHACPWSKRLWLDGFQKLSSILSVKELSDLQQVMIDKEIHVRTDIYEILLQNEMST